MKLSLAKDTTSKIIHVFIQDSSSYVGAGLTGLLYGATGLAVRYVRDGGVLTNGTLQNITTLGTWGNPATNHFGLKLMNDTTVPGLYELHLPNNILATGAEQVVIMLRGAANMVPVVIEIQLESLTAAIGTPVDINGGGASLAGNLKSMCDDAEGVNFDSGTDSLRAIRRRGDLAWTTGVGSPATNTVTATSIVRTQGGDDDGGEAADVNVVDGVCFVTDEINNDGAKLEVDATFTVELTDIPVSVRVWGYYAGGGGHYMRVQAYNFVDSVFELVGSIGNGSAIELYTFGLTSQHINPATGIIAIKFIHNVTSPGIVSHALYIDKVVVTTADVTAYPDVPDVADIVAGILAMTGVTEGGTWAFDKVLKILNAWAAGNWIVKSTDTTVQQLIDPDDGETVILEQSLTRSPSSGEAYRDITVEI